MQYVQRKLHRSVTEIRRSRRGRPKASRADDISTQNTVVIRLMSRIVLRLTTGSQSAVPALVAVTAGWGLTFVQVKDAVAVYPLFPFLALRFAIAALVLAPFGWRRVAGLGRRGWGSAGLAGALLAGGYTLQTLGLERTTVSSAGFVTGMYVVLTPLIAYACFG